MLKLLRKLRLRKMVEKKARDPFDAATIFLMNDQSFVDNVKKYYPERYELIRKYMKDFYGDSIPDCCICCMAFYWKDKMPACTLGGEFTEEGQAYKKICDNCVIKEG